MSNFNAQVLSQFVMSDKYKPDMFIVLTLWQCNCPRNIAVADSGIDAVIKSSKWYKKVNYYWWCQIKTDEGLWNKSAIANELFGCSIKKIDKLKSAVRESLDSGRKMLIYLNMSNL